MKRRRPDYPALARVIASTRAPALAIASLFLALVVACSLERTDFPPVAYGVENGQWRSFAGDPGSSRYSPLSQVDADNFGDLEIAWSWTSADVARVEALRRSEPEAAPRALLSAFQATPLMVDGVLYGSTAMGQVFALDAGTGRELWVHDPESYRSAPRFFRSPKHRGVSYWKSGDDERIFMPTIDAYLLALDATTGEPVRSFGAEGRVDLLTGLRASDVRRVADYSQTSPAALYRDVVIVGSAISDVPTSMWGIPGDVRAYDARTGELRWVFHTVPAEGELGIESWQDESWRYSGAANVWGPISVDPERGTVYLVTSEATNDLYGGHRPGNNLFSDTLLCLNAETGERIWHFQLVRHGIWDYDPAAPPNLVDIRVDGVEIEAVAQPTKQGFVYVFDRATGEPVWPVEDRPVPRSDVPGEKTAATQPVPTRPPPFERQGISEADLVDFTPELRAQALEVFKRYRGGPLFTPPSLEGTLVLPGAGGGANWRGAGFDPESRVLYVPSIARPSIMRLRDGGSAGTDFRYVADLAILRHAPWGWPSLARAGGLPLIKPPYSQITAIDLDEGTILWQVANGDGPRDHPRLKPLDLPALGSGARAGVLVTRSLLVASDGADLFVSSLGEPILRAYDKATGRVVGEIDLPGKIRGVPMTYLHAGKQYLALTVGDFDYEPALVALALP